MDNFDIRGAKLLSIIGLILFIFIMVIANAYQYLPTENSEIPDVNSEINQPIDNTTYEAEKENDEETQASKEDNNLTNEKKSYTKSNNREEGSVEEKPSYDNLTPLENISDNDTNSSNYTNKNFEETFADAKKLVAEKQLVKAISGFQDAYKIAETTKQKADCYEEIATIYALAKKYGTALSFAQKAYNLSPSTRREVLLARLYYKTGSTDKASDRVNNILRRDFTQDN